MSRIMICAVAALLLLTACGDKGRIKELSIKNAELEKQISQLTEDNITLKGDLDQVRRTFDAMNFLSAKMKGVKARIVTNMGDIELAFFPEKAPLHCFNFITRAESGFYDGTRFHRVMRGFMIQGGDPNSKDNDPSDDGLGGPLVNIPNEFNDTSHKPGILSMARQSNPAVGAGCQFFIVHESSPHLDRQYTAFGEVTRGMNVVNEIANLQTNNRNYPLKPVIIRQIKVSR